MAGIPRRGHRSPARRGARRIPEPAAAASADEPGVDANCGVADHDRDLLPVPPRAKQGCHNSATHQEAHTGAPAYRVLSLPARSFGPRSSLTCSAQIAKAAPVLTQSERMIT